MAYNKGRILVRRLEIFELSSLYGNNNNSNAGGDDDAAFFDSSNSALSDGGSYWKLPNEFSMFLTQRSIQSFMFLTSQLRDPETCYWVEEFTQPNLVQYEEPIQSKKKGNNSGSRSSSGSQQGNKDNTKNEESDTTTDFSSIPHLGDITTGGERDCWTPKKKKESSSSNSSSSTSDSNNDMKDKDTKATNRDDTDDNKEEEQRKCHLLRYHGLAAMDTIVFPTWDSYFELMIEEPTDTWIIASEQSHIPNYTWNLDPMSLCARILSVREQLSKEFLYDLQVVSNMGGQTLDWYWTRLKQQRDDDDAVSSSSPPFLGVTSLKDSRDNLLFLEINVDNPLLDHKPSPLRRGNFDLLVLLATEEAIHRVLNHWEHQRVQQFKQHDQNNDADHDTDDEYDAEAKASHTFLESFYEERQHIFHGPLHKYGKADDILEELLDSAIIFRGGGNTDDDNDDASLSAPPMIVHPTKIAELVLKEREQVAIDWMAIVKDAPNDHMRIQALRLEKLMNPPSTTTTGGNTATSYTNGGEETGFHDPGPGAFE